MTDLPTRIEQLSGPSREVDAWQPIETAPRDGRDLLLYSPDAREPSVFMGSWCEFTTPGDDRIVAASWTDSWTDEEIDADPSHWMPLPAPPVRAREGSQS